MHPDPKKVQGITEMTAPTDKQQLQSFLGMVNYMGTFIPNLSHHTEPLRAMLKKDNVFHWDDQQTRSFQQVKTLIANCKHHTVWNGYDRNLLVTVKRMLHLRGLGACPHTATQRKGPADCLCQQESHGRGDKVHKHREGTSSHRLCLPYGSARICLEGAIIAESDHKPLEMIAMKNLANAPPLSSENAAWVTEIQCDHQVSTREGNATGRCP